MMEQIAEALPQSKARTIGVVYLLSILTAFLGAFLINGLVVPSDAAATANSLLAHETLYRSGFAFYDLLLGYLIFRSTFLPRILGVLLMLAGVGWLTFAWPPLATALFS